MTHCRPTHGTVRKSHITLKVTRHQEDTQGKATNSFNHNGVARTLNTLMHIKGRLLDQAMILFNYDTFQMGTSHEGKNLLREGANSFLYEQFFRVWKITFCTLGYLP